jgi:hypothetical protein
MNKRFKNYQEELIKSLQDPEEALAYLNAAFTDEDPRIFLLAIKNVLEAQNCSTIDLTNVIKLPYKKYIGNVVYDNNAKIFHGEITILKDVITFQGSIVRELEKAFKDSVNDYLLWCKERTEDLEDLYDIREAEKILAKGEEEKGRTLEEIEESLHKKD